MQRTLAALSTDAIGPALQMPTETPPLTKCRLGRDSAGEEGCARSDSDASDFRRDPACFDLERIQRNVLGGQARIPA